MKSKKALSITFLIIFSFASLYYLFLWDLGKTYESIGESLNVPTRTIKTISIGEDVYALFYSAGTAYTSHEWWVKKNGNLIYHINSHDGQIDDLIIKNGKVYLVGIGVQNVDLYKENNK